MTRKIISVMLCLAVLVGAFINAEATRRQQVLNSLDFTDEGKEDDENVNYGDIYYGNNLPGPESSFDWSGYSYNGVQIEVQDTSQMTDFKKEEIKNFSDAIVDYLGWEAVLGSTFYDFNENMLTFKAEGTGSKAMGYSKKKFSDDTIKFQARFHNNSGVFTNWMGLMVRSNNLQYVPWEGMNCYLIVFKEKQIELQKYFPDQEMLLIVQHENLKLDTWHTIELENVKKEDGVHLKLIVDGKEMFSYLDENSDVVPDEGYVNIYYTKTLDLKPIDPNISHNVRSNSGVIALKPNENIAYVDGTALSVDSQNKNVKPYIKSNRTLVPLRFVAENIGMEVIWEEETRTAVLKKGARTLKITSGFQEYELNEEIFGMDVSAEIVEGRMFVPIRFVSEAFSKNVVWEDGIVFIFESEKDVSTEEKNLIKRSWK